jgi:hypothetical protein
MSEYGDPIKEVKLSYRIDAFLLHLVQENSKKTSAEILNFFHELSKQVSQIGAEKRTGRGIRKKITDYFPGTSIPFHLDVKGYPRQDYDGSTRKYSEEYHMHCEVEIGFPDEKMYIKEQALDEIAVAIMEKALMDGEEVQMAPFIRPEIKSPKMYKKLMDSFAGRVDNNKEQT